MSNFEVTYDFLLEMGLINTTEDGKVYYDPVNDTFEVVYPNICEEDGELDEEVLSRYIELPSDSEYEAWGLAYFNSLPEAEKEEWTKDFSPDFGFFQNMRHSGVLDHFKSVSAPDVISSWEEKHGVHPDWEHASL